MTEEAEKKFLNCTDCVLFDPKGNGRGLCRRNSPANGVSVFPMVLVSDWCGDLMDKNGSPVPDIDFRPKAAAVCEDFITKDSFLEFAVTVRKRVISPSPNLEACLEAIAAMTGWSLK